MKTAKSIKKIMNGGFDDSESLIKQNSLEEFTKGMEKLDPNANQKNGYHLPPLDTIGKNLAKSFPHSIKKPIIFNSTHYQVMDVKMANS